MADFKKTIATAKAKVADAETKAFLARREAIDAILEGTVTGGENPRLNGDEGGFEDRPSAARLPSCSRPSRTRVAASRWPSAILDCRCARRRGVRRSGRRDGRLDRTTG